jgi:competence protein ComEC
VRTTPSADLAYGRTLQARGELRAARPTLGFPRAELLARRGVHDEMSYPAIRLGPSAEPSALGHLEALRAGLEQRLTRMVPGPEGQLAAGLLLGRDVTLAGELRAQLRATGTSHILAVSGFNVALIGGVVFGLGVRFLPRLQALGLAGATVAFYTLIVGAPPSAVRAALMLGLAGLASVVGRLPDALTALVLVAAVMGALDPLILLDLGFQLSFAATAGLVLLATRLAFDWRYAPRSLTTVLGATLAAQLFTLPLVLHAFHSVSLVSPLANVLVAPLIPLVMGSAVVALAVSWLPGLEALLAAVVWLISHSMLVVISWAASLPLATLATGHLPLWALFATYGFTALPLALVHLRLAPRAFDSAMWRSLALATGLAGLATVVYFSSLRGGSGDQLRAVFFDVAGDGMTLLETPGGRRALLGSASSPLAASALADQLPLLDRSIDLLVVTRAGDRDLGGLLEIARQYPIGLVLQPGTGRGENWSRWNSLLAERSITSIKGAPDLALRLDEQTLLEIDNLIEDEPERPPGLSLRLLFGALDLRVAGGPLRGRMDGGGTLVVRLAPELRPSRELRAQVTAAGATVIGGPRLPPQEVLFEHVPLGGVDVLELTSDGMETYLRRNRCRPELELCSWMLDNAKGPSGDEPWMR